MMVEGEANKNNLRLYDEFKKHWYSMKESERRRWLEMEGLLDDEHKNNLRLEGGICLDVLEKAIKKEDDRKFRSREGVYSKYGEEEPRIDNLNLYGKAVELWGGNTQRLIMIEEMAELTKELIKDIRGKENQEDVREEIADVEIMLEQMKYIYDRDGINIPIIKERKLKRLKSMLNRVG